MKPENAVFKPLDFWKEHKCENLSDVIDFAKCLEDTAFPIIREWHAVNGNEDSPQPTIEEMLSYPCYDLTRSERNNPKTGWFMAPIPKPYISKFFSEKQFGKFSFTYYTMYDLDIYCDYRLIEPYSYMGGRFDLDVDSKEPHYVYIRIDRPNPYPVGNIIGRCYLSGLNEINDLIKDLSRSLRAGCYLLSKDNVRNNLYLSGKVDINRSKMTKEEEKEYTDCLIESANHVLENLKGDFTGSLKPALDILKPIADYAHRFTLYFIGHSHMDLAWKWRYPESVECMKGTIETQLGLMERDPEYVYVETSAIIWKDLKAKYPDFWKRVRAAADRGQFEPQGGMICETDGQCVGAESWFRQLEYGQRIAEDTCGKRSTVAVNIDAFGFNVGLPKVLKESGIPYFVTQKLRYNEFTVFPYIHFWWEADDGSKVLTLHEYPAHANHIEIDELAKTVCIHHLTDGFYHIPIMWGYGNHGGGPLPVMMDRIDELKKQTVFPNIKYSGFTEFYRVLCETEDIDSLPTIKGELFLETHHKTYSVQSKTKFLNRECERRLLNAESLQAAAGLHCDLDVAWEKQLFNQFHDVLAGTSFREVYEDLYDDYKTAFANITESDDKCARKALGSGNRNYIFNPLSRSFKQPVVIDQAPESDCGYLTDSRGNKTAYQRTWDNKTVFVSTNIPAFGFEKYENISQDAPVPGLTASANGVDNGIIKVAFDQQKGVIKSLIFEEKEICNECIGELKVFEDTLSRDYDSWNFGFTGKEWDVKCDSFELLECGPVRAVFRAKYSFGVWQDKKPYYTTYLWHTPGVEYPTSFFTQDFIIYADDPMIRCELSAEWWEDKKVLKVSAQTTLENTRAFYQVPFGELERPVKRETPYEKARFEVPANTYGDLRGDSLCFALLNRSKHGYDVLDNRIRLTLLTSPYGSDKAKVPDTTADRGKHKFEYAFLPHSYKFDLTGAAESYERGAMVLQGSDEPAVILGKSLIEIDNTSLDIKSVRLLDNGNYEFRAVDKNGKIQVVSTRNKNEK